MEVVYGLVAEAGEGGIAPVTERAVPQMAIAVLDGAVQAVVSASTSQAEGRDPNAI